MIFGINRLELPHKKAGCDMDKLEEYQRWQNNLARVRFPRWKELPTRDIMRKNSTNGYNAVG